MDAKPWTADDGTRWIYSAGLDIFTGWVPGEDGCWTLTPEQFREEYPDSPLAGAVL